MDFLPACQQAHHRAARSSRHCLVRGGWARIKDPWGDTQSLVVVRDPDLRLGRYDQPEPALSSAAWAARKLYAENRPRTESSNHPGRQHRRGWISSICGTGVVNHAI
jgi:hypothetical protein